MAFEVNLRTDDSRSLELQILCWGQGGKLGGRRAGSWWAAQETDGVGQEAGSAAPKQAAFAKEAAKEVALTSAS